MLEHITGAVVDCLSRAGFDAGRSFPRTPLPEGGLFVKVGIASVRQDEAGFARYLGMRKRDQDGGEEEVYGMAARIELRLDIYAGMERENAAADCESAMDELLPALAGDGGLRIGSVSCGEAEPDRATGFFRCRCRAEAGAEIVFAGQPETGQFTDFILKGELRK